MNEKIKILTKKTKKKIMPAYQQKKKKKTEKILFNLMVK